MVPLALLLQLSDPAALVATARTLTAAEPHCHVNADSTDVTVCGLRNADRFRVPLIEHDPGDPAHEGVWDERKRLLHRTTPLEDLSIFQVGGGMAGITAGSKGGEPVTVRPLAP